MKFYTGSDHCEAATLTTPPSEWPFKDFTIKMNTCYTNQNENLLPIGKYFKCFEKLPSCPGELFEKVTVYQDDKCETEVPNQSDKTKSRAAYQLNALYNDFVTCNPSAAKTFGMGSMNLRCNEKSVWAFFYTDDQCKEESDKTPPQWGWTRWLEFDKCQEISPNKFVKVTKNANADIGYALDQAIIQ